MPWFFVLFQSISQRGSVKPASEDQSLSGDLSNLRIASLEGVRAFRRFSTFSDKFDSFRAFDNKPVIGAVRIALPHSPLRSSEEYAPTGAS